jgi:plasmid stability protein
MAQKYTFLTGERVEIVAETEEEARELLNRGVYTESVAETRLLIISFGRDYHRYPSVV